VVRQREEKNKDGRGVISLDAIRGRRFPEIKNSSSRYYIISFHSNVYLFSFCILKQYLFVSVTMFFLFLLIAFILIVNRGECHFTEKVRNAAKAGAVGVIVADNIALANEPLAYCPDYTPPQYYDGNSWVPCTTAAHGLNCKCGDDHSVAATLLTSAPTCSGNTSPEYQPVCTDTKVVKDGPCWYCPPGAKGGSAQSFPSSCFHGKETTNCQRKLLAWNFFWHAALLFVVFAAANTVIFLLFPCHRHSSPSMGFFLLFIRLFVLLR
jgi:hypothetical protein